MRKLELKHIAPYLPYGLKGIEKSYKVIMELHGASQHGFTLEDGDYDDIRRFKPILRPLSGLTKEIEVNGEQFVPRVKMGLIHDVSGNNILNYSTGDRINILSLPYYQIEYLFEWHFDVFGLIPLGLAISYNDL